MNINIICVMVVVIVRSVFYNFRGLDLSYLSKNAPIAFDLAVCVCVCVNSE